jgi:putative transposase
VGLRRTKHAVFDIKYHLVWIPKYRRKVLVGEVAEYTKEMLQRIADEYGFWVDTMEVMEDHVHVFLEVPPKFSPAEVVQILKSVSAREVFKKFRRLRRELWSGELWSDGYFVRSVGDKVTADVIRRYIEYQTREHTSPQLPLFE